MAKRIVRRKNNLTAEKKRKATIERRQQKLKEILLEEVEKTTFLHAAGKRAGVSRTTIYRWIHEDGDFGSQLQKSRAIGEALLVEVAESQLFKSIQGGDLRAIMFYLSHRSPKYGARVANEDPAVSVLTPEKLAKITMRIKRWKKEMKRVRIWDP